MRGNGQHGDLNDLVRAGLVETLVLGEVGDGAETAIVLASEQKMSVEHNYICHHFLRRFYIPKLSSYQIQISYG